jgi:hypothetical protein
LIRVDSPFVYRFEAFLLEGTKCNNNGALKVLQRLKKDHKKDHKKLQKKWMEND